MTHWQKVNKLNLVRLREHYLRFEPYCHLNIVDLWSYRAGPDYWFEQGDTIVYQLYDYNDNSIYITVLGKKSARAAIKTLCDKNKDRRTIQIKCLPESTLMALGDWDAVISSEEDPDNHDYIFDVNSFINFSSRELKEKYATYQKLVRRHPHIKVKVLDQKKASDRRLLYRVFRRWVVQTSAQDWQKEYLALKRALTLEHANLVCLGFFDGRKMIGYTVNEPEPSGYYQAYFGKADRLYKGLGILQEHKTAKHMKEHFGSEYMNLQPDQGIEGLRHYKTSLGPLRHLKKYSVVIDVAKARH